MDQTKLRITLSSEEWKIVTHVMNIYTEIVAPLIPDRAFRVRQIIDDIKYQMKDERTFD